MNYLSSSIKALAYVSAVLLFGIILSAFTNKGSYTEIQQTLEASAETSPAYPLLLVAIAAISAFLVVRYSGSKLLKHILSSIMVVVAYFSALYYCAMGARIGLEAGIAVSAVAAIIVAGGLYSSRRLLNVIGYTILGVLAGVFMSIVLVASVIPVVLGLFAVYDLLAVLYGPLKKLPGTFSIMLISIDNIKLGLGDITFYVLSVSALNITRGLLYSAAGFSVILAGVALTLLLLSRLKKPVPGLTLPLLFSLPLFYV